MQMPSCQHGVLPLLPIFCSGNVPYSGVLASNYVNSERDGDAYSAFDDVMEAMRKDILGRREHLEVALAQASYGKADSEVLDGISPSGKEGKWAPVRRAIEALSRSPREEPGKLDEIVDQYKNPQKSNR